MRAWNWQSESPSKYEVGEASWKKRVCRTQRSGTSRGKPGLGQKESRAGGTWLISEGNRGEKPSHDRVHARSQSSAIKTAAEKAPAPAPECPPAFLLPSCGLGPGPFTASCLAEPRCPLATPTLRLTRLPGTAHSLIQLVNLLLVVAQPWRRQTGPRSPMRSVSRAEWREGQASCEADGGGLGPARRSQPRGARR